MVKQIKVDVEKSLGFQANGRLKPADKTEYADKNVKTYECPKCNHKAEANKVTIVEYIACPNCCEIMTNQLLQIVNFLKELRLWHILQDAIKIL